MKTILFFAALCQIPSSINLEQRVKIIRYFNCDQTQYDIIYKAIILETMNSNDFRIKANEVETLRKLCNGQKSSYERN